MTKRSSEGDFGAALREVDLSSVVFKPADDARTWKPCDFMVWHRELSNYGAAAALPDYEVVSTWFECKDLPPTVVHSFPFAELRPSQLGGIREAERVGIPYWLAVYWRRHKHWTISDAVKVLAWRDTVTANNGSPEKWPGKTSVPTSIPREILQSRLGVDSSPALLSSTLKSILLGDV